MTRDRGIRGHYTLEEKKLALTTYFSDRYRGAGVSLKTFSSVCGINHWTLRDWARAIDWDRSRIGELADNRRVRKPTASSGGLTSPVRETILAVKAKNSSWGPLKIKQYLFRHEQILIPQTSIYRFLKERGLVLERPADETVAAHDRSFEYPSALAAVQMDLMAVTLASGLSIHLVTLLDDFSRFVLAARFVAVKTMEAVTEVFRETTRLHGVMEKLLTDCGSEFVSWQRFTRFEELLVDLDVEYISSGPDKAENQGKVERWHQTVRQALRERGPLDYSSEAQLWIRRVTDHYNYERPHQALGGLVPADRFFGIDEELTAELEQHRRGLREAQRIYVVCRAGGRRVVVSGSRPEALSVLVDGVAVDQGGAALSPPRERLDSATAGADDSDGSE